ncbi:AAA family ATPase [Brevibacillus dissolubilis]|uniref:AAA family ATPase n=1 Tax=Brevibacillus dissolubilis TaxID=1844116 RepID=UPI00159BA358|nr:AAA family ATPase [Brevibacillus dissolubilis]
MCTLPLKHLSARVPWHDNKWNGTVCCNVVDNSFCRILPKIDSTKDPDHEKKSEGVLISEWENPSDLACLSEKGTFLSPHEYTRLIPHAWQKFNKLFNDFQPGIFHHKPYSFNAVPFLWMMKDPSTHESSKAKQFGLLYDPSKEESVALGFEGNVWVQHPDNQQILLDSFFNSLQPHRSLIFFYAKHTPLSEPSERIIVGVACVREVGKIVPYRYPEGYRGHRSFVWDRCIGHTLTNNNPEGFLMPYHEILDYQKKTDSDLNYRELIAVAPDFLEFSYSSELVEHDTAIDSLFAMATALKNTSKVLEIDFTYELKWIEDRVSELWDMRGGYPGMGAVLAAFGFCDGLQLAWEIEKHIYETYGDLLKKNPWEILDQEISNPGSILGSIGQKLYNGSNKRLWMAAKETKKQFLQLLSRCQLDNQQAADVIKQFEPKIEQILDNPYLLFEQTRRTEYALAFSKIDKAVLPVDKVRLAFPLPRPTALTDDLDERRVRALLVSLLEEAATSGHSLLPEQELMERIEQLTLAPPCRVNSDLLQAYVDNNFLQQEVVHIPKNEIQPISFFKLRRLVDVKAVITRRINKSIIEQRTFSIQHDWNYLVNNYIQKEETSSKDILARQEKAEALRILCNYRFSLLIGPAGSGKTTLLKIFENIPGIKEKGVLKLAPTGKARVKLGFDAQTVAQFLTKHKRYDYKTGIYHLNPDAAKYTGARTIIVDEASMLSEDQLGALLDALGAYERLILVGDYRQLPPIGTGKPFMDLVHLFKPNKIGQNGTITGPAYAELVQILRQESNREEQSERSDVVLSRCFTDEKDKSVIEEFLEKYSNEQQGTKQSNLRLVKWYDSSDLREKLKDVLREELLFTPGNESYDFNISIGGTDSNGYIYFNVNNAEKKIEKWQVLSPVNGYGFGVKEINKFIQTTYRQSFIDLAHNLQSETKHYTKRKIAKPKGSDNIVYGDKVINLRNSTWKGSIHPYTQKNSALCYIANGEIGIVTGKFLGKNNTNKGEPPVEIAYSTQPGYSYVYYPNQLSEEGNYPMELAYCISVHKSQGSGFETVFFILPESQLLSRELLYTALTRQEKKIIIMHQGDFHNYLRYTTDEFSEAARRFTDLFFLPDIKEVSKKRVDSRYINVSERGEFMISKSEVIIANCLYKYEKEGWITYGYESRLTMRDGRTVKPDFIIENLETGQIFYWEHLGMMTLSDYREKWEKKLQAYKDSGFVLHTEATLVDDKILIISEDHTSGGINSQLIDQIVQKTILGLTDSRKI